MNNLDTLALVMVDENNLLAILFVNIKVQKKMVLY